VAGMGIYLHISTDTNNSDISDKLGCG